MSGCRPPIHASRPRNSSERGQILPLFAVSLVAMMAMAALLFDGAHALVLRRQYQNTADAAALAASNVILSGSTHGCSSTTGPPPGSPRQAVVDAAKSSVQANLPSYNLANVVVTCPDGWDNFAVKVDLATQAPTFFGAVVGIRNLPVGASGTAINGQFVGGKYSVVVLDPAKTMTGCPSVLFSGGPTAIFDGSLQIDSACGAANGGALGTNGNAATLTFNNAAVAKIVGNYVPGRLTITPTPQTGQPYVPDPLSGLPAMSAYNLPTRHSSKLVLNGGTTVLQPGIYTGGIQLKNSSVALLEPGIYVIDGGDLNLGAQSSVFSVDSGVTSNVTTSNWGSKCGTTTCGVLIYNKGTASGGSAMGQISVGAGATMELRPYLPSADLTGANVTEYQNLLFWQDASPVPSPTYAQPAVNLNGGGTINISGTVYAPSAQVYMTGGSGGSGGSALNLTLQFICYDLQIQGNATFHFFYQSNEFAKPTDYGLVQ
jgi:Putative Flp pilus-assembly TadE/G-like